MGDASRARLPYLPALDGLRGAALVAILLLHGGVTSVRGGHLALTAFFTLSGFLITALLLVERHRTGTVDLRQFWVRRARRLVPALLVTFPLVAVVVLLSSSPPSSGLLLDAVAAATWVANWRFVLSEQTYADLFALPSPFQHFWSLAVEEQFYLVFPLVLLGVLGLRRARPRTGLLAALLAVLVVGSTVWLAVLHAVDGPLGRAYYGTDARLAEILVGSLLALAMVGPDGLRPLSPRVRRAVGAAGLAGLAGLLTLFVTLGKAEPLTYRGGFLLAALCTAAVVAAGTQPRSLVARVLSVRPLVRLGLVSYGVYLFHWPLFLLLTEHQTGLASGPLLAVRLSLVLALAFASYAWLEAPVRAGHMPALPALGSWATGAVAGVVVVAAASTAVTLVPEPVVDEVRAAGSSAQAPLQPDPSTAPPEAPPVPTGTPGAPAAQAPVAAAATAPPPRPPAPVPTRTVTPLRPAPTTRGFAPPEFTRPPEDVPPPTLPPSPPPSSEGPPPLKVAVVGDSIAHNLATGLQLWAERDAPDVQVVSFALGGCPVARGDRRIGPEQEYPDKGACPWWFDPSSERQKRYVEFVPDVVLITAGISETFDRKVQGWEDWRSPGDPRYDQHVVDEHRTSLDVLSRGGQARVLLADAPCGDWGRWPMFEPIKDGEERVRRTNRTYLRVLQAQRVGLFDRLCPGGKYSDDVEGVPGGRYDGFHITDEAALALARNWLGPIVREAGGRTAPPAAPLD